jgi:TetR/AcrR family tetracycline transcriptional repressor
MSSRKDQTMTLQREVVVNTALRLLDSVGLNGLTMRRLAEELGVQNPALYWHFRSKQDLLDRMAEVMVAETLSAGALDDPWASWSEWLSEVARQFRAALLSHRDATRVIAGANLGGSLVPDIFNTGLRVLQEAGFSPALSLSGMLTVFGYTFGAAFDAQADPFEPPAGVHPGGFVALRAVIDPARYPVLAATLEAVAREAPGHDRATEFEEGLQVILAGLRALLPQH